jgi:hypothetical protein
MGERRFEEADQAVQTVGYYVLRLPTFLIFSIADPLGGKLLSVIAMTIMTSSILALCSFWSLK